MRKVILVLALFAILTATIIAYVVYRRSRPVPTPFGWKANVITLAGDGSPLGVADPFGVAVATDGSIYFTESGNNNRIQKIAPDGNISSLAGGVEGYGDGVKGQALFNTPSGLALAPDGDLIVADTANNRIRRVPVLGETSTVAGDGTAGYADGPADKAQFNGPIGVAVDPSGNIYVADSYNDRIRLITTDGQVSTVAGRELPDIRMVID